MVDGPVVTKVVPETNRPYAPPSNITDVLKRLRSRNIPERIDIEYLRDMGVSEGTLSRAFFALRWLELADEYGTPSPALRSMAMATDEEYRSTLAGIIREKYVEVFQSLDPAEDPQDRLVNFFRRYTPGSQRERMVIFFLGMCREAGIPTLDQPRQRSSQVGARATGKEHPRSPSTGKGRRSPRTRAPGIAPTPNERSEMPSMPPALEMLVRSLPGIGSHFPKEKRDQWVKMAEATLVFLYPDTPPANNNWRQIGLDEVPPVDDDEADGADGA